MASTAAILVSMQTFLLIAQPYWFDEAGVKQGYLKSPEIGFITWIASMACVSLTSLGLHRRNRRTAIYPER